MDVLFFDMDKITGIHRLKDAPYLPIPQRRYLLFEVGDLKGDTPDAVLDINPRYTRSPGLQERVQAD